MLLPGKNLTGLTKKLVQKMVETVPTLDNYGLYSGKTGMLVALHTIVDSLKNEFLQQTKQTIEFLQTDISENAVSTCDNFADGIFGIGWGIDFLYKKRYITENEIEVLNSFDDELYKLVMYSKAATHDLEKGSMGRINYYLNRIPMTLKLSNKYRYVCNYEILMLLTDDFTNENENLFKQLENKSLSILKETNTGKTLANIFILLQMLILENVHKEITEKQWLQCLQQLVWFYENTNEEMLNEESDFQLNFLYIINCLLRLAQANEMIKNILLKKAGLMKAVANLKLEPSNTSELLLYLSVQKLVAGLTNADRITTTAYLNNFLERESFVNWNVGLAGISGLICIISQKENFKFIETAFLIS